MLPTGAIDLLINLGSDVMRVYDPETLMPVSHCLGPLISGPRVEAEIIDTEQQREIMGAQIRPGGARALFSVPANHFYGNHAA